MPSPLRIVRSAIRLDRRERRHAVRALGWIALAQAGLLLFDYGVVRRLLSRAPARRALLTPITPAECSRAIDRATRIIGARCLARALAAAALLRREGHQPTMTIGVQLRSGRDLTAHAWVEAGAVTVTGGDEAARYAGLRSRQP